MSSVSANPPAVGKGETTPLFQGGDSDDSKASIRVFDSETYREAHGQSLARGLSGGAAFLRVLTGKHAEDYETVPTILNKTLLLPCE